MSQENLIVQVLTKDNPRLIDVCRSQDVNPDEVAGGASFMWQDNLDDREPNPNYAAILVDIPDSETDRSGRFLRNRGYVEGIPVVCRYQFAPDGVQQ